MTDTSLLALSSFSNKEAIFCSQTNVCTHPGDLKMFWVDGMQSILISVFGVLVKSEIYCFLMFSSNLSLLSCVESDDNDPEISDNRASDIWRQQLMSEFKSIMQEKFMSGADAHFDYR